jgi:hypothetical protein
MIEKDVTQEEWEAVYQTMIKKLENIDEYKEILDPLNTDEQMNSLSEGIADIYQDLKDFIASYNMGTVEIMNDAIWDCKKNFKEYWGQRLVNILRVLHYLLYSSTDKLKEDDAMSQDDFDPENWDKNNEVE